MKHVCHTAHEQLSALHQNVWQLRAPNSAVGGQRYIYGTAAHAHAPTMPTKAVTGILNIGGPRRFERLLRVGPEALPQVLRCEFQQPGRFVARTRPVKHQPRLCIQPHEAHQSPRQSLGMCRRARSRLRSRACAERRWCLWPVRCHRLRPQCGILMDAMHKNKHPKNQAIEDQTTHLLHFVWMVK